MRRHAAFVIHLVEHIAYGAFADDAAVAFAVVATAPEQKRVTAGDFVQATQHDHQLPRQGYEMRPAHFHFVGGDRPQRVLQIEFFPVGIAHHAGAATGQEQQPGCCHGDVAARAICFLLPEQLQESRQL